MCLCVEPERPNHRCNRTWHLTITFVHVLQADEEINETDLAEREEGELSDGDDFGGNGEYEAISSDEELKLRQKIEALEARNMELEQIASISAKSKDSYGELKFFVIDVMLILDTTNRIATAN